MWHFQTVHHDLWDSDLPPGAGLVDIKRNGKTIPALAAIGKPALMFILDRTTGKPVFGVEERPVPKGDVPGEWYSPTQPFPLKPPQLARNSFDKDKDMVTAEDTTPEHAKACQDLWDRAGGYYNAGPYHALPVPRRRRAAQEHSAISRQRRTNWGGTATDPKTGYIYVQTHDAAARPDGSRRSGPAEITGAATDRRSSTIGAASPGLGRTPDSAHRSRPRTAATVSLPCQKPPWGQLDRGERQYRRYRVAGPRSA